MAIVTYFKQIQVSIIINNNISIIYTRINYNTNHSRNTMQNKSPFSGSLAGWGRLRK